MSQQYIPQYQNQPIYRSSVGYQSQPPYQYQPQYQYQYQPQYQYQSQNQYQDKYQCQDQYQTQPKLISTLKSDQPIDANVVLNSDLSTLRSLYLTQPKRFRDIINNPNILGQLIIKSVIQYNL